MAGTPHQSSPRAQTILTWLACVALVGWLLSAAQAILVPLALAVLLTFMLGPLVTRLQRVGSPKSLAVITVVCLTFAVVGGMGWLLSRQLFALAQELPAHRMRVENKIEKLKEDWKGDGDGVIENLLGLFETVQEKIEEEDPEAEEPKPGERKSLFGFGEWTSIDPIPVRIAEERSYLDTVGRVIVPLLEPLATAGLVIVLVIFMLLTREDLRNRVVTLSGRTHLAVTTKALDEAGHRIARYLQMQALINLSYGMIFGLGLWLIGVDYAPLWGIAAAVLRYIPYVGPWIGAILPLGYSALVSDGWADPLGVLALTGALEVISNNVVEPLLYGRGVGVSSVAVILSAVFWGWMWGPVGLILATPLTVCLVVAGRHVPALAIFNRILGDVPEVEPHYVYYQRLLAKDDDEAEELFDDHAESDGFAAACEQVVIPALELANRDRMRGLIEAEQLKFILEAVGEHLEEAPERGEAPPAAPSEDAEVPVVFAYGMRDAVDERALQILERLMAGGPCRLELLPRTTLLSEVVDRIRSEQPAGLCLVGLPPGGLTRARTLAKRIKTALPELKIAIGRWGSTLSEKHRATLREAGVGYVGVTPAETREHLLSISRLKPQPSVAADNAAEASPAVSVQA